MKIFTIDEAGFNLQSKPLSRTFENYTKLSAILHELNSCRRDQGGGGANGVRYAQLANFIHERFAELDKLGVQMKDSAGPIDFPSLRDGRSACWQLGEGDEVNGGMTSTLDSPGVLP